MAYLVWADATGERTLREIAARTTIGRSEENDLVFADGLVSRKHCVIEPHDGGWRVVDLGSRFGTFVDDVRVDRMAPLPAGSRLRLGGMVVLTFAADESAARVAAVAPPAAALGRARELAGELLAWLEGKGGAAGPVHTARALVALLGVIGDSQLEEPE